MDRGRQRWLKQGLIFAPAPEHDWLQSHAALPVADRHEDFYRVYFSSRDKAGRAQIGFLELDLSDGHRVRRVSGKPVLGLGTLGAFDDNGVTSSWIVNDSGKKYHYYSGWSLGVTVPFYFYIGLAVSTDGGLTFDRFSRAPVLGRNEVDPYLTASPCVLRDDDRWRMWYVSGTGWEIKNGKPQHRYHIKYAESADGIHWRREGTVCIDYKSEAEYAIARPCVLKVGRVYKMWYSTRGDAYRIGYAESDDGIKWIRKDEQSGLTVSDSGWDSEMVEYAYVFDHQGKLYMLYNGNGYGKTGIGLARLDTELAVTNAQR